MSIQHTKGKPKNAGVYRQFVFVGHTPHGARRELVAADRREIDAIATREKLSGLLTYHNVKVWPKGSYHGGQFVEGYKGEDGLMVEQGWKSPIEWIGNV